MLYQVYPHLAKNRLLAGVAKQASLWQAVSATANEKVKQQCIDALNKQYQAWFTAGVSEVENNHYYLTAMQAAARLKLPGASEFLQQHWTAANLSKTLYDRLVANPEYTGVCLHRLIGLSQTSATAHYYLACYYQSQVKIGKFLNDDPHGCAAKAFAHFTLANERYQAEDAAVRNQITEKLAYCHRVGFGTAKSNSLANMMATTGLRAVGGTAVSSIPAGMNPEARVDYNKKL